jgi:hypothetical protein
MREKRKRRAAADLPEDVRELIRAEIESGLDGFRAGGFEAKMRAVGADAQVSAPAARLPKSRRVSLVRWASVYGPALVIAAFVIAVVAIPTKRGLAPDPSFLAATLETLPGIRSLNLPPLDLSRIPAAPESPSPLLGALAAAAAQAEADAAIPVRSIPVLIPRYTLEQKIEILTKERPIERALALMKSISGEV